MLLFLRKTIPLPKHVINTISSSTSQQFLCLQTQCLLSSITNFRYYSTSLSSNHHSFTVSYLIHTCGFSPQEATSATKYVTFDTPQKPDLVINFLKTHGFSKPQIRLFTKDEPRFLKCDPHKTLLPKIEFFKSKGIPSSLIPKLLCSHPKIMKRSLHKQLIPSFDFLQALFQSDDKFFKALTRFPGILIGHDTCVFPNLKLLREVGVPESNIILLLQTYPRTITKCSKRFNMIVMEALELGFDPLKYHFVTAISALTSLSKVTWLKKANVYKKWGWSDDDTIAAFKKFPRCMSVSEDKIDGIMEVLVDKLGFPPSTIINYAVVLSLSLNKRIVPRASVIQVLFAKGLVKKESCLYRFVCTEREFLEKCVLSYGEESGELLKLYQAKQDLKE